jgi:pentatricopeptide repeat protein
MSEYKKLQVFNNDQTGLCKRGNFNKGESIYGKMVIHEITLVTLGMPDKFMEENHPVNFQGKVHEVNEDGDIVSFILLTEINPPSNDPQAIRPPTIISLNGLKSYSIYSLCE